jgi:hypothetical protein
MRQLAKWQHHWYDAGVAAPDESLEERPFQRTGTVGPDYFWDRAEERRRLERLIAGGEIGFVEGPRRVGKSSLALLVKDELEARRGWRIGYLNLRTVTDATLPDRLVTTIAALTHRNAITQLPDRVRALLGRFRVRPQLSGGWDTLGNATMSLKFEPIPAGDEAAVLEDILELLAEAPKHARTKVALIVDEFQEVLHLAPLLPDILKASFQSGRNAAVIMMGSRHSIMHEIVHSPSAPLYRIGPSIPVGALPRDVVREEIVKRFGWARIKIEGSVADAIFEACEGIPQDIQTVCAVLMERARLEGWLDIGPDRLPAVLDEVLTEVAPRFLDLWTDLSTVQQELLAAIAQYGGASITRQDFLERLNPHRRRTSGTILKAAKALKDRDVLESANGSYHFKDPFFALYLKKVVADPLPDLSLIS